MNGIDIIDRKVEVDEGIENKTITLPDNILRYRYIAIVILIVIIVIIINQYSLHSKRGNIILNLDQINVRGLIVYLIFVVALFNIFMSFQNTKNRLTDAKWDILHFIFYFFLAYFVPNNWGIILVLEVVWEVFEDIMGFGLKKLDYIETDKKKIIDIIANSTGYLLGNIFFSISKVRKKMDVTFARICLK